MSAEKESLESVFRNALEHAEMPVDPAIWQAVSGGIGGIAGGTAGSGVSLFAKVAIGVVAAGGVTTAAVFLSADEPAEPSVPPAVVTELEENTSEDAATDSIDWKDVVQEESTSASIEVHQTEDKTFAPDIPIIDDTEFDTDNSEKEEVAASTLDNPETEELSVKEQPEKTSYGMDRGGTPTSEPVPEPIPADDLLRAEFKVIAVDKSEMQYRFAADYAAAHLYFWQVDDEYVGNLADLVYMFKDEGEHEVSLTVRDASGQERSHLIVFTVERPSTCVPEIPNVFTPNNDGYNDVLDIEELSIDCEIVEFRVHDVLGALVFEANESMKTWDGLDPFGNRCPEGIYRVEYVLIGNDGKSHPGQQYVNLK